MSRFFQNTIGRRQKDADLPVQDTYRFTCYVPGDKSTFSIRVPRTANVDELTQFIWEKGGFYKLICRISQIKFWKVCQDWRAVWM